MLSFSVLVLVLAIAMLFIWKATNSGHTSPQPLYEEPSPQARPNPVAPPHASSQVETQLELLKGAARMLEMQLALCHTLPEYAERLDRDYVRGYLMGFFKGSLHYGKVATSDRIQFLTLMSMAHQYLFATNNEIAFNYVTASIQKMGSPAFNMGHDTGFTDYCNALNGSSKGMPVNLARAFRE